MIDEKDVLYNIETKNENKIVTLVELLLSLAAGILINHCTGNLNLSNSIDWACYEYDKCKLRIYEIKNDIKKIDDKILALNKKRG